MTYSSTHAADTRAASAALARHRYDTFCPAARNMDPDRIQS
jgi:hypothetical protein